MTQQIALEGKQAARKTLELTENIAQKYAHKDNVLEEVRDWLGRFIKTASEGDLHILTLWIAHTYLLPSLGQSPRLLIESPVPGSGKSTVLDHINRLGNAAMQAAVISSPALIARTLSVAPRTILIDEAEKSLTMNTDVGKEVFAVINAGYREGATRPVLTPLKDGGWETEEHPLFAAVAMAGNSPKLPEDTRQRCIRILLLPDREGTVETSRWRVIEDDALALGAKVAEWALSVQDAVAKDIPDLPKGLTGRSAEVWEPMLVVARAAGGKWEERCLKLIAEHLEDIQTDAEAGLENLPRHVMLLKDIRDAWPEGCGFWPTTDLLAGIKRTSPTQWTSEHKYGDLTPHGLSRVLTKQFNIRPERPGIGDRRRGYYRHSFESAWASTLRPTHPLEVDEPAEVDGST
ncbi:DUF3631 domain-containing protein [Corynebacterium gerontici]|uniref:DUF3631 domain-containing protein n=1 Tax=Corynebacterium gerontici TaxID=2079234 RepID=A0A3G6J3V5_9CORY|nr:DUF3631 domain-containing protein [Corynebacterium gerontici]AZA11090.1 hypothetical protein CGERO_03865 [Corynebacterium gerontici]